LKLWFKYSLKSQKENKQEPLFEPSVDFIDDEDCIFDNSLPGISSI